MTTEKLKQIKNNIAKSYGMSWEQVIQDRTLFDSTVDKAMTEAVNIAIDECTDSARMVFHNGHDKTNSEMEYFQSGADNLKISKQSITKNKIK